MVEDATSAGRVNNVEGERARDGQRLAFVIVGEGDANILSVCLADPLARLFAGSGADLSDARCAPGEAQDNGNKS